MFSKLTEGVQSKLVDLLLSPAAFFWLFGLVAFCDAHRAAVAQDVKQLTKLQDPAILAVSVALLLLVVFSAAAYEPFNYWVLDRLAGYWGALDGLAEPLRAILRWHRRDLGARYQQARELGSSADTATISALETKLHFYPSEKRIAPTRFGCALVASDMRIALKYGLSANICWPALSLVLSDTARKAVTDAQAAVEASGRLIFWAGVSFAWLIVLPSWRDRSIAAVALVCIKVFGYCQLVTRGREYADAYENAFAVGRFALYDALRLAPPETFGGEIAVGKALTNFILRGATREPIVYVHKP